MLGNDALFRAQNIGKQYPGTNALQGVNLEIYPGEVVALIGENGAGKSTLLKIITGVEPPSTGSMEMRGAAYSPKNPIEANKMGVGMVFQEQSLIQNLTVGQNIFLGQEKKYKKLCFINWAKMYQDAEDVLKPVNPQKVKADKKIRALDLATRQMIEIAKVLNIVKNAAGRGSMILLDEPTSVLNDQEVKQLFEQIRRMKDAGNSVIFVSHRLDEVLEIADRIYVFKDGKNVGVVTKEEANEMLLYEKMVGRTTTGEYFKVDRQSVPGEDVLLEVKNLGQKGYFKDVSFKLHKREIIGICGVIGSGKEQLCAVLCGDEPPTQGEILVKGEVRHFASPHEALQSGIISIPRERREEGIVGILSISDNMFMSNYEVVKKNGFISKSKQRAQSQEWIRKLNIKASGSNEKISRLSGGNAQKVIFSRVLSCGAEVLILNNPTRGVDIGAKEDIYSLIRDITAKDLAVILLGDTLDECIELSSKVIVMKDGLVTMEYDAAPSNKPEQLDIVKYMM